MELANIDINICDVAYREGRNIGDIGPDMYSLFFRLSEPHARGQISAK